MTQPTQYPKCLDCGKSLPKDYPFTYCDADFDKRHTTPATKPLDEQGIRTTTPHPLDKELDYILRTSPAVNLSVDDFYLHDLFVRLITLINDAEKQARIDELEGWTYCGASADEVKDRIK